MEEIKVFYILNMNIAMIGKEGSHVVFYLRPLQLCSDNLHDMFDHIRTEYLPYHIKQGVFQCIPSSYLNYCGNITVIDKEEYFTRTFNVKFSNIRGYQEHKDRYIKLRDYIFNRRERYSKEED